MNLSPSTVMIMKSRGDKNGDNGQEQECRRPVKYCKLVNFKF